uniref:NADH dehydrogenase subunit 9 n=1 Tax=Hemiaulus sinensis TaxID=1003062 RepID=UPI0020289504|nr:NADH dehydrogenase subunit 9 [Hemiaulus sinensis]QYB23210.1 NADH dehydrogenase subunit 9 [Hemiaulus sinensis]
MFMSKKLVVENLKYLSKLCPLEKIQIFNDNVILIVKPNVLFDILVFFKYHVLYQFELLTCISGVDYPMNKYRFKIVYELLSIRYNFRIRIKTFTHELLAIESCDKLFLTGGWYECEVWDMFGVFFKNHSNLKRILTDYGFEGYPLRKDFPLSGFIEMRYNEIEKRVVNESLELCQEYRTFTFLSPWQTQKNL